MEYGHCEYTEEKKEQLFNGLWKCGGEACEINKDLIHGNNELDLMSENDNIIIKKDQSSVNKYDGYIL